MTEGSRGSHPPPLDDFPARFKGSESFLELMRETIREVYWFAFSLTLDHSAARTLTYRTYRLLWDRRRAIRQRGDDVLVRLLSSCRRLAARREAVLADAAATGAASRSASEKDLEAMRQASASVEARVARGSASQQELYRMSVLGDVSYGRAAAELGFEGTPLSRAWHATSGWLRDEVRLLGGRS